MNRSVGRLATVVLTGAVLCLVAGAATAKNPERPFRGRSEGAAVGPCVLNGVPGTLIEGRLIATHVGLSKFSHCAIITGGSFPVFDVYGEGAGTAANGDNISYVLTGTIDVSTDPCEAETDFTVLGGTGRFEGASGDIHVTTLEPKSNGVDCGPDQTSVLNGTITY